MNGILLFSKPAEMWQVFIPEYSEINFDLHVGYQICRFLPMMTALWKLLSFWEKVSEFKLVPGRLLEMETKYLLRNLTWKKHK